MLMPSGSTTGVWLKWASSSLRRPQRAFTDAFTHDPKMAQAAVNEGIALLTLQKLDEAEKAFHAALALEPGNAQAWYNLGLAQHADNELDAALTSFQQATRFDPRDADSYYFEGVCYGELKDFEKEIDVLKQALAIQPLHASSEFAMARALQRAGRTPEAKEHFRIFQHLTSAKISAAIGLAYGEQGHYSTVTPVEEPQTIEGAMIPVRLEAQPMIAANQRHRNRRRVHDRCHWLRRYGPRPDAVGFPGYSHLASPCRWKV